ncbi:FAD-dependent oxidoreductase [Candidatus Uhrbacteria bacterium]|nr:FAD-dependent oxidoreductase [Candidatus Uhrbacteria bacterium]
MKKIVSVVGGGIAGLTAAYMLSQRDDIEVHVFEARDNLGGRIQSKNVNGTDVDFGGFLIYPWYKNCHALLELLGLTNKLSMTPMDDIYYVLSDSGIPVLQKDIPFSKRDVLEIFSKSLLKLLPESNVANPGLDRFGNMTISEYLRSVLKVDGHAGVFESYFDTVNQGYCYGPVNKTKAAFMAPIVRQTKLHGDVYKSSYFHEGTGQIIQSLSSAIEARGGRIHLGMPVTGVDGTNLIVGGKIFASDMIVFAQTVTDDLYKEILPDVSPECWYTHFITATMEFDAAPRVNEKDSWGAVFYESEPKRTQQILSAVNLASLYGEELSRCINVNVVLRSDHDVEIDLDSIERELSQELAKLFPLATGGTMVEHVHWKATMPVSQEAFVQAIREHQGLDGYYFAGDYLGAPSIETAVSTGKMAAELLISSL